MKIKKITKNKEIQSAGIHVLLDFWAAKNINSVKFIRKALIDAVKVSGFKLLKIELHKFSPYGVSGVAIIAESHISIHTWPEYDFAAIDIFLCGEKDPNPATKSLKNNFKPKKITITKLKRGILR